MTALAQATTLAIVVTGALAACAKPAPMPTDDRMTGSPGAVAIVTQRAAATAPVPGTPEPVTIPVGFQGRWGVTVSDCDPSNPKATGGLTLGERSVTTFAAPGTPTSVAQPVPLTMTAELTFHRDDRSWTEPTVFRLTDGATILERSVGGVTTRYRRCVV